MLELRRPPGNLPLLVAHRGASALAPENTLAAFRLAAKDGADIIELDVHLSSDEHVVVIHDAYLSRTTNGVGKVARKTLIELRALDAGGWFHPRFAGEPIPTLTEALAWARAQTPPPALMIELKGEAQYLKRGLAKQCVRAVAEHGMADRVIFISFYHPHLRRVKAVAPHIATGTIFGLRPIDRWLGRLARRWPRLEQNRLVRWRLLRPLAVSRAVGTDSLSIPASALTPTLVEAAHLAGLAVSPGGAQWDYSAVIALGADTLSAEDPATVRAAFLSG